MSAAQYPLALSLREAIDLEHFCAGPNAEALAAIRRAADGADPTPLLIRGAPGSGRSHLLQGAARQATLSGRQAIYLPLAAGEAALEMLQGLDGIDLVCVDDIDAVAHSRDWSIALARLLDARRRDRRALLLTASEAPERLDLALNDLRTRLTAMASYVLKPLDDAGLSGLLRERAAARGLELGEEAAAYLVRRLPRDAGSLIGALDALDRASLSAGRRLSLPFVQAQFAEGRLGQEPSSAPAPSSGQTAAD